MTIIIIKKQYLYLLTLFEIICILLFLFLFFSFFLFNLFYFFFQNQFLLKYFQILALQSPLPVANNPPVGLGATLMTLFL